MKSFKRIIATVLVLTIVLTIQPETFGLINDSIAKAEEKEKVDLPYCIPEDAEGADKHVKRIKQEEDEFTVVYENEDGTITVYTFTSPVQYRDAKGNLVLVQKILI